MDICFKSGKHRHEKKRDVTLEMFNKIKADEKNSRQINEEVERLNLSGNASCCEESNAKCNKCSSGLSAIEIKLYGNRCVFCAMNEVAEQCIPGQPIPIENIGFLSFLIGCYYDLKIYRQLLRLFFLKGKDARMDLLGCLGIIGYTDINQVKKIQDKRALLKELRGMKS